MVTRLESRTRSPLPVEITTRLEVALRIEPRLCSAEDLPALEWMGLFTRHREIIASAFRQQLRGDGLMLLGIAHEYPVAQAWLDFVERGSRCRPWLWAVRVFPPLQGLGIGSWLLGVVERIATSRGAREIELGVEHDNPGALRLYRRLGYRPCGKRTDVVAYRFEGHELQEVVHQQLMRKRLPRG